MATDEELIKLVFAVAGMDEAEKLRDKVDKLREQIVKMGATLQANDPQMVALARQMKDAADKADELEKKFGETKNGLAGMGQALQQTGRVSQDFVAGFMSNGFAGGLNAVSNNIEQFTQSLGGSAGMAGALTVAGVALMLVTPHIQKFLDYLMPEIPKTFSDALERVHNEIETINALPVKTIIDENNLRAAKELEERLKKAQAAYDALSGRHSQAEKASMSAVGSLLDETPGGMGKVKEELRNQAVKELSSKAEVDAGAQIDAINAKIREIEPFVGKQITESGIDPFAEQVEKLGTEIKKIEDAKQATVAAIRAEGGSADRAVGDLFIAPEAGKVDEKQKALADALKKAGREDLAKEVAYLAPDKLHARTEANEDDHSMEDLDKAAAERAIQVARIDKRDAQRKKNAENLDAFQAKAEHDANAALTKQVEQQAAASHPTAPGNAAPGPRAAHPAQPVAYGTDGMSTAGPNGNPAVESIPYDWAKDPENPKNFAKPGSKFATAAQRMKQKQTIARLSGNKRRVWLAQEARKDAARTAARRKADKASRRPTARPSLPNLLLNANPFDVVAQEQARRQAEIMRLIDEGRKSKALGGLSDFGAGDERAKILAANRERRAALDPGQAGIGGQLPEIKENNKALENLTSANEAVRDGLQYLAQVLQRGIVPRWGR